MTKQELREQYLEKRSQLTVPEYDVLNVALAEHFFASFDLWKAKVIHVYLPIPDKREADTWRIINQVHAEHPHVTLVVPRIKGDMLEHIVFEGPEQLTKGRFNVPEPKAGLPVPVNALDIVLVPLLICDAQGNRVGYGKGYYDRFLIDCRKNCLKIGMSHFKPVTKIDDVGGNDIPLDGCLTPVGLLQFNSGRWPSPFLASPEVPE